jgi:hypothetical protein
MACAALIAQRTGMTVILLMAGCAICWRALEVIVDMAVLARDRIMFSVQFESKLGVIYRRGFPACRVVTGPALIA